MARQCSPCHSTVYPNSTLLTLPHVFTVPCSCQPLNILSLLCQLPTL
jgi:hypothetical protein